MTNQDIALTAGALILGYMIVDSALDFFVPGRWQARAYRNSIQDLERMIDLNIRQEYRIKEIRMNFHEQRKIDQGKLALAEQRIGLLRRYLNEEKNRKSHQIWGYFRKEDFEYLVRCAETLLTYAKPENYDEHEDSVMQRDGGKIARDRMAGP